jgi:branched-chain amino acid transport system substrate-binding protein
MFRRNHSGGLSASAVAARGAANCRLKASHDERGSSAERASAQDLISWVSSMLRICLITTLASVASFIASAALAQGTIKIGAVQSMTGPFNQNGRETMAGARLYMQEHGDMVAGKKIEIIVKDDASVPHVGRRIAQELIVNDKVSLLLGGITPSALSIAPLTAEAKIPMIVMVSGASITVERSPYIVRTGFTLGQSSSVIAGWALKNGTKRVVTLVNDWAPGVEAETTFNEVAVKGGAEIVASLRVPLTNPDFAPFLQRARDLKPDTLFVLVPNTQAAPLVKQFLERGMDKSGIRLVATGDLTPDDDLPNMSDAMLGLVTAHHYSALHESTVNKAYVEAFRRSFGGRPTFHSVAGYDAMHLIYQALEKTGGNTSGDALVAAMKGMKWESPRGPIAIDPETRDIIQNEYIRKVEKVNGEMYNFEFATIEAVKDPLHGAKK